MKWIPYGPDAWLLQFAERLNDETFRRGRAIAAALERDPPPGLVEYVSGLTTVLLEFDSRQGSAPDRTALAARLKRAAGMKLKLAPPKEVPVVYDGPDLERVAKKSGLSPAEVCRLHSRPIYKVYLLGFSPGFPYLGELDKRLHTPRLETPRLRVPAGAVAIGGEHTGIYSVESPGGWNIIGHTPLRLFNPALADAAGNGQEMFFLKAGDRVKFVPRPK